MATKKPAKAAAKKTGRPSAYSEKLAETICDAIADGASLRQVCARDGMPDRRTVERWMAADHAFATKCARAREEQAEVHHDQMGEIEAKVLAGKLDPKAANVVLSNKRWRMEKLSPKYSQRVSHEVSGPNGGPVETINRIERRIVRPGSSDS